MQNVPFENLLFGNPASEVNMDFPSKGVEPNPFLRSDVPLESAAGDRLDRYRLAQLVANRVANYHGPKALTVGVCGPWGSGKTSFLNLLLAAMDAPGRQTGQVLKVEVSPWALRTSDDLAHDILVEIGRSLDARGAAIAVGVDLGGQIAGLAAAAPPAAVAFQATDGLPMWARAASAGLAGLGAMPTVRKAVEPMSRGLLRRFRNPTLQERQERISQLLRDSNTLLVVALDDLERMPSDRIQAVFRVVTAIGNFANTVYILAMDKKRTATAIEGAFGDGHAYLEKFLNLTFDLPAPDPDLMSAILVADINAILDDRDFPEEMDIQGAFGQVWHAGLGKLFSTPRDIVRALNSFDLALAAVAAETHPVDLFALEVLRIVEPRAHAMLSERPVAVLRGGVAHYSHGANEKHEEKAEAALAEILEACRMERRESLAGLLRALFPSSAFAGPMERGIQHRTRRVADKDHFDTYFRWGLAPSAISQAEVLVAIEELSSLRTDNDVERWVNENRARFQVLGEKLMHYTDTLHTDEARYDFAAGVLLAAHLLDDSVGFARSDHMLAQSIAHQALIRGNGVGDDWVAEIWSRLQESVYLYGATRCFAFSMDDVRTDGTSLVGPDPESQASIDDRLMALMGSGSYDDYPQLGGFLYRWRDVVGTASNPRRLVQRLMVDRPSFVWRVLDSLLSAIDPDSMDGRRYDGSNLEQITGLFEIEELASLLESTPPPEGLELLRDAAVRCIQLARENERLERLQQECLDMIVDAIVESSRPVKGRQIRLVKQRDYRTLVVNGALDRLQPDLVTQQGRRPNEVLSVTFAGLLQSRHAPRVAELAESLLKWLRTTLQETPTMPGFGWSDLVDALSLEAGDFSLVLEIIRAAGLGSVNSMAPGARSFDARIPDDIEAVLKCRTAAELRALRESQEVGD